MVIATDILEHMEKEDGVQLLEDMHMIAKHVIYIEVPETYIPQDIDIWAKDGHTWQTHRSSGEWSATELEIFGFTVVRRSYTMSNAKRHSTIDIKDPRITLLDGVRIL